MSEPLLEINEPIVSSIEITGEPVIDAQINALLGRWQAVLAALLIIPQVLIIFAVLDVASGLSPLAAVGSLVAVQAALLTNHQLDTRAGARLVIDGFQAIDFADNRVDDVVDDVDAWLKTLEGNNPAVIEVNPKGG